MEENKKEFIGTTGVNVCDTDTHVFMYPKTYYGTDIILKMWSTARESYDKENVGEEVEFPLTVREVENLYFLVMNHVYKEALPEKKVTSINITGANGFFTVSSTGIEFVSKDGQQLVDVEMTDEQLKMLGTCIEQV